ncbi:MAG TPA: O-antigen ligase family protein [Candidatus Acidoferrales bacterium]
MDAAIKLTGSSQRLRLQLWGTAALICSFAAGMAAFWSPSVAHAFFYSLFGVAAVLVLLIYPEVALALYVVIGDLKGDDRIAALLPVDLTLALGALLLVGIALNLLRHKRVVRMPASYFLFIALVAIMTASLTYTPVFDAGLEKLGRFLTVTGIVIVAPFFLLGTRQQTVRFFASFAVAAFAICAWSLFALGGSERLVTPSNNTIGLGHIACALILILWFAALPFFSFPRRFFVYPLLSVPVLALIGSGSRGPAIACALVILGSAVMCRSRILDLVCALALGSAILPFARVPGSAIQYLGTLVSGRSVSGLLSFRYDLLEYGWRLLQQHPLVGTGIQGFRYYSPNPELYKWPHNIFLEIACELGIPAALIACTIFAAAIAEAIRQLRDTISPAFLLSQLAAALLVVGAVNATNTGDINSDRLTWLFLSLVFVMRGVRTRESDSRELLVETLPAPA